MRGRAWMMLVFAPILSVTAAHAADCAEVYTVDKMVEDLVSVETFLRNEDNENAGSAADHLRLGLPCMTEILPRMIVGRALRAIGSGLVVSGDAAAGEDWLRTSAEIEQAFDFGLEDLPEFHPVRDAYAAARRTAGGEELTVENAGLVGGTVYLDGRKVIEPKARLDRWHVLQLDDGAGSVKSWTMEGNRFPDALLVSTAPVVTKKGKTPKTPKTPKPSATTVAAAPKPGPDPRPQPVAPRPVTTTANGSVVIERDRPWEKTPLMIAGGAILSAGTGVYFASRAAKAKFEASNDDDVVEPLQRATNRLAIATVAILGVGTGTFTWGVILDGEGGLLPAVRFRF